MIEKNEVLKMASGLDMNPDTVEKDYVLGWVLHGINQHRETRNWAFKGGTCLKKCFFETFRFSEDLDFTLSEQSQFDEKILLKTFFEITEFLSEEVGIEFFQDKIKFKIIDKGNGKYSAQGKIQYNGPLRKKHKFASIKLDLTTDEILVIKPKSKKVHHPYTDEPESGIYAHCYAFEELVAEKIRALAQRARPRDLYDVVHFFRNRALIENPALVYNILQKKCSYKQIAIPTFQHIEEHEKVDELEPQWKYMLAHQLSHLPDFASFWNDLSPFFDWLEGQLSVQKLVSVSTKDEQIFYPGRVRYAHASDFNLQRIQFAAANRVCIVLRYHNKTRTVEPLSFRTSAAGNQLFYGFEREAHHIKAYSISEIQAIEITNIAYTEKHPVEISASGKISMPPIRRTSSISRARTDSNYVYECSLCGKKFNRKKKDSILRPHKDKNGRPCSGRRGILVY